MIYKKKKLFHKKNKEISMFSLFFIFLSKKLSYLFRELAGVSFVIQNYIILFLSSELRTHLVFFLWENIHIQKHYSFLLFLDISG